MIKPIALKKWHYWLIGILLLMAITNPTLKDLEEHISLSENETVLKKFNFLVLSVYEDYGMGGTDGNTYYEFTYIGILGNFIQIGR